MNDENSKDRESADEPRSAPIQPAKGGQQVQPEATRGRGSGLAVFAALISVLALGASGYIWYYIQFTQQQNVSDVVIGLAEIGGRIEHFGQELDRIAIEQQDFASMDNVELAVERNFDEVREQQEVLKDAVNKINRNFARGIDAWLLEEVEQMLRVAIQGLALTGNRGAATRALKLADEGLQSLADPRYTAVRLAIAQDISALENSPEPDITGIATEMIVLAAEVSSLPLINEPEGVPLDRPDPADQDAGVPTWRTELRRLFSDLVGLVKIQKVSQSPRPLLAPEQRYFLEQNLQVILQAGQLALLNGEYELFRRNVDQAIDWVEFYFDSGQPVTAVFLADLNRILTVQLAVDSPDISSSLTAYKRARSNGVLE